jgi:KDO2-lipid IV(A) lauroyltransferase
LKKLQHILEFWAYLSIEKITANLPERSLKPIALFFAFLAFRILKIRRHVVFENLKIAFPEKSDSELYAIASGCYKHFSLMSLEFMKLAKWSPEKLKEMFEYEADEEILSWIEGEKGFVFVSGHFGNWEVGAAYLSKFFRPCSVIQTRQSNAWIDNRMANHRRKWGMEIIYRRGSVHNSLKALKQNRLVGLLGDQDIGEKGIFVSFFGRMASTPPGPALLHYRAKTLLTFAYIVRVADFRFKAFVKTVAGPKDVTKKPDYEKITTVYTKLLENAIRMYPDQYFWLHKRWKSKYNSNIE